MRYLIAVLALMPTTALAQDLTLTVGGSVLPGEEMTIDITGALASQKVRLARSTGLTPGGWEVFPGVELDLVRPRLHGNRTANLDGEASFSLTIPEAGQICWQAISHDAGPGWADTVMVSNWVCLFTGLDSDGDGIVDGADRCEGHPDSEDDDEDGFPNACDICPADPVMPADDIDEDGVCGDECPRDPENDADADGICGDDDICPYDPDDDIDGDGVCGDVDPCPLDENDDTDGDGLCDSDDDCINEAGFVDADGDGICDADDRCPDDPLDGCLKFFVDEFDAWDGTIWDSWPYEFTYDGAGSLLVSGNSAIMRSIDTYEVSSILGSFNKDEGCDDHYVVLTDNPDFSWSWGSTAGAMKFVWNCSTKYIYGPSSTDSVSCSDSADYDIEVSIVGDTATFTDTLCADLTLSDPLLESGPLYVWVGADCDGCTAEWYRLEVSE